MTVTAGPPVGQAPAPDAAPELVGYDVRVLDAGSVLDEVVAHRRAAEASEARVLMLAVHYVDLHPVTLEHPAASAGVGDPLLGVRDLGAVPDAPDVAGLLAGEGTPGIAEGAVEELGAVLGVPYLAAYALCADSVAVCYRLPRIWERLHAGLIPAWRATMVARETRGLSLEAAGFVDRQVAILIDRRRFPTLRGLRDLVHEARLRMDPDHEQAIEEQALAKRGVWFDHQTSTASAATTNMSATLDAWDALELDAALTGVAADLRAVGDTRDLAVRRAEALALLADPQRVLDLGAAAATADSSDTDANNGTSAAAGTEAGSAVGADAHEGTASDADDNGGAAADDEAGAQARRLVPAGTRRSRGSVITLYVHASLADLAAAGRADCGCGSGSVTGPGARSQQGRPTDQNTDSAESAAPVVDGGCVNAERLGPMLLAGLRTWLGRTDRVVVRPVLDPTDPNSPATRPIDRHDPPPAMRDLVTLRDGQCLFPGCRVDARSCDLDHINPYLDPDNGGPPGQTRPANLACLCRRHHRLKTFTDWDYKLEPDGSYTWVSPRGQTFTTHPLSRRAPTR
jgi:hypothetical protein